MVHRPTGNLRSRCEDAEERGSWSWCSGFFASRIDYTLLCGVSEITLFSLIGACRVDANGVEEQTSESTVNYHWPDSVYVDADGVTVAEMGWFDTGVSLPGG